MTSSSSSTASPTTATAATGTANLDDITASLFYQLRDKNRVYDFDVLQCPKCPERLEALELDVYQENGQTYQRIWWTCRGIKNQSCHFPLWVPREVFWTRRTEEQMKSGYIPLPNIHLLPQRLWYLYPNIFRDELSRKGIVQAKKDASGVATPSSGHATRGSSVRPESVLTETENEEYSQDSFRSTPLPSAGANAYVPNEAEIWESKAPLRQIRIDEEDMEEGNVEPTTGIQEPDVNWQQPSGCNDAGRSQELNLNPEYIADTELPPNSVADSFDRFYSQSDHHQQQQHPEVTVASHENNDEVVLETLHTLPRKTIAPRDSNRNAGKAGSTAGSVSVPEKPKKRSRKGLFGEECDEFRDRIALLVSTKTRLSLESENLLNAFRKRNQQQKAAASDDDATVISSLLKELTLRVALEFDFIKKEYVRGSVHRSPPPPPSKIISLEEAKKSFGDLTLEEYLKGVNSLRSSAAILKNNNLTRRLQQQSYAGSLRRGRDDARQIANYMENTTDGINLYTEFATNLDDVKPSLPKRRRPSGDGIERPPMPKNLPADESCIAAVELALKQSINGGSKGPEETIPAPRPRILKGSPSEFRHDMISNEIFDPLNWRRPVHFGGHTNLDAFVTSYNLRYNRAEYLDALGSELCKRKIMKFVPSIPVKQQRLVRRLQQKRSGQDDTLDLEMLKKAVDPNALRLQIAHRLGIKEIDSMVPTSSKVGADSMEEDEISTARMQHIGSAPLTVLPEGTGDSVPMEFTRFQEGVDQQPSTSNASESLYSFAVSGFDHDVKTEREREMQAAAAYIPSFNDPEVDALVHRKFKNYAHDESTAEATIVQYPPLAQHSQQISTTHLEASATTRIEYADFESAFEEYEDDDDVQQLDPIFDAHFDHHSL